MPNFHFYEPRHGHGLQNNPLDAIIAPRPIGWLSTQNAAGVNNLAPYSFFNAFNYDPPILGFASFGWKDTVHNIEATGEFVWNLVTVDLAQAMILTAEELPAGQDEFTFAKVTPGASRLVKPPKVAESPVSFECRLSQLIPLTTSAGIDIQTWLILGEVVAVHIRNDLIVDGSYDTLAARPLLRGGQSDYFELEPSAKYAMPGRTDALSGNLIS